MARVAALTMVYKDHWFLRKWMDYYGAQFGRENLYVLCHGRDPEIDEITKGANLSILPRTGPVPGFDRKKAELFSVYTKMLHDCYDAVVVGDVDELVAVDPATTDLPLAEAIVAKRGTADAINCFAWELRPARTDAAFDPDRGVLEQRPLAMCLPLYCKPAISFRPITYFPGQHASDAEPNLSTEFLLFHLRFANEAVFLRAQTDRNSFTSGFAEARGPDPIGSQWAVSGDVLMDETLVNLDEVSDDYDLMLRKSYRFMKENVFMDPRRHHLRFPFLYRRIKRPVRLPQRFLHLF